MNKQWVSLVLVLGFTSAAPAAEAVGDPVAGQAKIAVCGACHGPDGNSVAPVFPKLAGQGQRYLLKQLHEIRDGKRVILEMTGMLSNLSEQDLADMTAFFSAQKGTVGVIDAELAAKGEALFRGGKIDQGVPSCTGCHAPDGTGNAAAGFPRLSGQHADYVKKQLEAFREGQRTNDEDTRVMRTIASRLGSQDIDALSAYIQSLR
ncbi:cytochrome c [Pseudomonas sp. LP_7_YM]|uniref:c-type cytochrome n=1 Tax=Pseudomonas sp. LP_7_YM TaxID=2485137 RepID=UPI0010617AF0|nr:cytochrome c [Pseudomonas sp. LP_7_YM]TDV59846.1 cytochrome c553 [Pseudomonas sp. LP_7_YM]